MSRRRRGPTPPRATRGVWGEDPVIVQSALRASLQHEDLTEDQLVALYRATLRAEIAVCREDLATGSVLRLLREPGDRQLLALIKVFQDLKRAS